MANNFPTSNELLPHLFRLEYSKMTAVLCRLFGLKHIEIAEDIASETFLKATEIWSIKGLPENPTAWLYAVAKNKTKDYLKRNAVFEQVITHEIKPEEIQNAEPFIDFTKQNISDSQLAMIFAVCNPVNSDEAQICLALQILCGFSVEEIASAFLSNKETIKKRLLRARENLRKENFSLHSLNTSEIKARLDTVLTVLYLFFSEGYFSKSNNSLIRKDLCAEAIRLTLILTENPQTGTAKTNALLALMCFQSSRLDARINEMEEVVLFDEQDKNRWDKELIDRGNYYLVKACSGNEISKYHLEARIAYWHSTSTDVKKWEHVLELYNMLLQVEYSPVAALNRTFAFSKVYGKKNAIAEAEKLALTDNLFYHSLLGNLYTDNDNRKAIQHFRTALQLTKSISDKATINKNIDRLTTEKNNS
ncbi:MAG TPA: sigma-70 family RNA polymerase sigma factor [Flavitalea sp.]|nr:sigma-70 family RNA polymerase sigma factor [Flavitalea sp.]